MESRGNPTARAVRIRVPATTSNLGAAFDAAGLALQLYLKMEVRLLDEGETRLEYRGQDASSIPTDRSNLMWQTMEEVARKAKKRLPLFSLTIHNQIPVTKGLGSSASACVGAVAAADFLCGLNLDTQQILEIVAGIEGHPDNAAPAVLGGFVTAISASTILCSRTTFPADWMIAAVTPDFALETKKARAVLPLQIEHRDAVFNIQRAAFLVSQIVQGRSEGLREAMKDRLHQPYRSYLLPGLNEVLEMEAMDGLMGVALSGAGPTVIALADSHEEEIGEQMRDIFARNGLSSQLRILKADNIGLVIEPTL